MQCIHASVISSTHTCNGPTSVVVEEMLFEVCDGLHMLAVAFTNSHELVAVRQLLDRPRCGGNSDAAYTAKYTYI